MTIEDEAAKAMAQRHWFGFLDPYTTADHFAWPRLSLRARSRLRSGRWVRMISFTWRQTCWRLRCPYRHARSVEERDRVFAIACDRSVETWPAE